VIVSGIPVIANAKEPSLQKPDDGGGHDTCAEWILAISSDVAPNLKVERGHCRSELCHAGEFFVAGKI
jgi:hypothetical protein